MSLSKASVRINGSDENTPLITNGDGLSHSYHGEGGPGTPPPFTKSLRNLVFSHWINVLLVAVPLSFISHFAGWGPTADFVISFLAIVPLAGLLGDATEQVALKVGQTLGGLLNATFGNAVEAIVGIIALKQGQLRIVQTSMLGSILSNILLVLGCAFLGAGFKYKESTFQATAAQASASIMTLACVGLVIPAAYIASKSSSVDRISHTDILSNDLVQDAHDGIIVISRATAIVLFLIYILYLYFQLRSHAYLFEDDSDSEDEDEAKMSLPAAVTGLVVVTVVTAFCADYLVDSIDEFARQHGIPKPFIGLILLPIVGNAAEHVTSVLVAVRGKMELAIGVAVGSSIQIAVGVIPLMVIIGWIIGQDLTLMFGNFETTVIVFSVLLVSLLVQDGKSNYMEGAMLIALYLIIAVSYWES